MDTPAISRVQAIRPQLLPHTPHSSPISIIHSVDLLPCTPTHRHCQYLRSTFCALSVALLAADLPASQVVPAVKNLPANAGDTGSRGSIPGWGRFLGEEMTPTPVFWPGESPGQRSLVGYSPWDCKESDRTEPLTLSISLHKLRLRLPFSFKTKCNFPSVSKKTVAEKKDNKEMD